MLRPVPAQRTRTQGANTHSACTHKAGPQVRHWKQSSNRDIAIVVFALGAIAQGARSQNAGVQSRAARGAGTPGVRAGADGGAVRPQPPCMQVRTTALHTRSADTARRRASAAQAQAVVALHAQAAGAGTWHAQAAAALRVAAAAWGLRTGLQNAAPCVMRRGATARDETSAPARRAAVASTGQALRVPPPPSPCPPRWRPHRHLFSAIFMFRS